MKKRSGLILLCALALSAFAVDLGDLLNPDDVMLRRPARRARALPRKAPAGEAARAVVLTNVVTKTDYVVETNRVTQTDYVTKTNLVTQTDVVVQTNVVTQTDYVTKTNLVTQTDYVTKTNFVTQTDVVVQTNVVTQTDYVTKTNVVVEKVVDRSEQQLLEAARLDAEKRAVAAQAARAQAESETARLRAALAEAEKARQAAENDRRSAETRARTAERKVTIAETARAAVASQVDEVARTALNERKARERAEAEKRAAERRAEAEHNAALSVARHLDAVTNRPPPTVETADYAPDAPESVVTGARAKKAPAKDGKGKPAAPAVTGRDAIITAERMDFDRKEGVILFDRNVYIDDEQYQMHADRLFVFVETNAVTKTSGASRKGKKAASGVAGSMGGSTSLKRLVAIGHVSITNEQRSAYCARATYMKKTGKIVMYGNDEITPWILDPQQSATPQYGEKITFWTISEQVEIDKPVLSGAALGKGKGGSPLNMLKH